MDISPFPDRSDRADVLEVSRFSCTLFPGVHGVFDYTEPCGRSRIARFAGVAFPLTEKGRHSGFSFSQLHGPPASTSIYASTANLQCAGLSRRRRSRLCYTFPVSGWQLPGDLFADPKAVKL
jgi:hypothetical protein